MARGFEHWRNSWLTERGAFHPLIRSALRAAFQNALDKLKNQWEKHPYFLHLKKDDTNVGAAQLTLDLLNTLKKMLTKFLLTRLRSMKGFNRQSLMLSTYKR